MKKNEGTADRVIRVILGIILIGLALYFMNSWALWVVIVVGIVGLIALITGIIGYCGLYKLLKISTIKK
ncbi:MAG: DUF2892 domain-containing protein [Chloroflexi bacterium]|jgi:uncharacterized membrane protein HdeD (DUF308 family)|nr:DUF2892 domain-containing protein [Chloroflexota bacterium]